MNKPDAITILKLSAAAAVIGGMSAAAFESRAGAVHADVITENRAVNARTVWITVYDITQSRQLDWGCVSPSGARTWKSGKYLHGSFYYVRAEVKDGANCGGRTLCDTRMQINPQWENFLVADGHNQKGVEPKSKQNKVALRSSVQQNRTTCYLEYSK